MEASEQYVEVGGLHTWYEEHGEGDPLMLLHPGGADAAAFAPNIGALASRFRVFTPERRGHGHTPDLDGPITYELMAADTIAFIEALADGPVRVAGCSGGAVVALLVALRRADLVSRLVLVSGVFHRDGWHPDAIDPDLELPEFMVDRYGEVSPDGRDHHPVVAAKLARMNFEEPTLTAEDLGGIECRTLIMIGDDDEVALEHAIAMYRGIPDAELGVIPRTSHGLLVEKPELCNELIIDFLANEPAETLAPIRRQTQP
jgi:pimeloyl-ACP methyl ester carboxylesterase